MSDAAASGKRIRQFRQVLLWPLQLMPIKEGVQVQRHWEVLEHAGEGCPWREVVDEYADPAQFGERHYNEFITFLPHVQRFLYGEGRSGSGQSLIGSPMRFFRRSDVKSARVVLAPGATPILLQVKHVDLYFFLDIDVVLLNVEVLADGLPLQQAQDLMYRFGRGYPACWEESGEGQHCPHKVEWLDGQGAVLAASDYQNRSKYLSYVCRHKTAAIAAHWEFLLRPLALDGSDDRGVIRYRQIEYYRLPIMAYLAAEDPRALTRNDFIRLGMVTAAATEEALPFAERHVTGFEQEYCYDRYWSEAPGGPNTRFMCNGHALIVVGDGRSAFFIGEETGVLAQFRHQYFLLFLIAHMQRAALLMFSNRLVTALDHLEIHEPESVKGFKRSIRQSFEIFLRFSHRYWFHELSDQAQVRALYNLCTRHLGTDALYEDVKREVHDMAEYLDSDSLRRQANTVVRLTVVTTFGLIGTVATGFLGMNLIAAADTPFPLKLLYFLLVLAPVSVLTFYTIVKSKRLSDFLEMLSDERISGKAKLGALIDVWRGPPRG